MQLRIIDDKDGRIIYGEVNNVINKNCEIIGYSYDNDGIFWAIPRDSYYGEIILRKCHAVLSPVYLKRIWDMEDAIAT